jgi:large subunit ribosomal protein L18
MIKRYKSNQERRAVRTRAKTVSSSAGFRLSVNRSNKFVYAQIIDISSGKTLFGVKAKKPEEVGKNVAEKAIKLKIERVVFDRGSYRYHGRVKLLADSAKAAGLIF